MRVVTVASNPEDEFLQGYLIPSVKVFGLQMTILQPVLQWSSHRIKDLVLFEYLRVYYSPFVRPLLGLS